MENDFFGESIGTPCVHRRSINQMYSEGVEALRNSYQALCDQTTVSASAMEKQLSESEDEAGRAKIKSLYTMVGMQYHKSKVEL